jgi:CitB family two-component system response regulator MalR
MPHILFVDDDPWFTQLYGSSFIDHESYDTSFAHSASEALKLCSSDQLVDLIVLDMHMPGHNGIELLHELASYDDLNTIAVILLSSAFEHEFKMSHERWKQYGVVEFLYKPTTKPDDLLNHVKKHFARIAV